MGSSVAICDFWTYGGTTGGLVVYLAILMKGMMLVEVQILIEVS